MNQHQEHGPSFIEALIYGLLMSALIFCVLFSAWTLLEKVI